MGHATQMPTFRPRDTERARELRNRATPAERQLWRYLGRSQLGVKFSRQMPVGPFFADFLCRGLRLIVELDGFSHDLRPAEDAARDRYLAEAGYRVVRFSNAEVMENLEGVLAAIRRAVGGQAHP